MNFVKNIGVKTVLFITGLLGLEFVLFYLWKEKLLPVELFIIFGIGCLVFIVLNIIDRKNQLRKSGDELIVKGDELFKKGELKGAMRDYQRSMEMRGPSWGAYIGLGQCYRQLNDYKKCLEYAKLAMECKSDSAAALFLIGICLFRQDYHDSALKHINNALAISPDLTEAYLLKGEIFASLGKKEEAIDSFKQFREKTKDEKARKTVNEKIDKLSQK
ncbi:MAG: tetratricopeptide repeat protein [Candidatus Xenobiia bacterium LiM19]